MQLLKASLRISGFDFVTMQFPDGMLKANLCDQFAVLRTSSLNG